MKNKFLIFLMAICFIIPCAFMLSACEKNGADGSNESADPIVYSITISDEIQNGVILADKQTASAGEIITLDVQANNGYELEVDSLKYDNIIIENNRFIMPRNDVIITANFIEMNSVEDGSYHIWPYYNTYSGTVVPDKSDAYAGEVINLTINPNEGYTLEDNSLTINGELLEGISFVMPEGAVTISASFVPITYSVNYHTDGLTTNENPKTFSYFDNSIQLKEAIKEGYLFKGWFLEDGFQNEISSIINQKSDVHVYPKFEEDQYTAGLEFEKVGTFNSTYYVKGYNGTETDIIIPNTYKNCTVDVIIQNAFKDSNITSIKIPNNIVSICENAFKGCINLTEVHFEEGSQLSIIKSHAFHGCQNLEGVTIPKRVEYIEEYAFESCIKLKNISFEENSQLLELGNNSFEHCEKLENVTIPDNLRRIGEYVFAYDNKLANVTISENCYFLDQIGAGAFYGCTALSSIYLPSSLDSLGDFAFRSCTSLTSITIRNVSKIGINPFAGCTSLETINSSSYYYYSPIGSNALIQRVNGNVLISGCKNTIIPKNISGLEIGNYAFNLIAIEEVILPRNVVKINQAAFNGCSNLEKMLIVNDKIESIEPYAFYGCNKLTNIYFSGTEEKWNEAVGNNYIGADTTDITYYNLEMHVTINNGSICHAIDRNDIWHWPDLKKNYFIGDTVSYENALLDFYGNTYDLTDNNTGFSTATEGEGLISVNIEELDITFLIYEYHVTSIATKVYEEIAKHNKMYAYITDKNHNLTGIQIIENGNYFYTSSFEYILDPQGESIPTRTEWQIKEDEQNYYTRYVNQKNLGSRNDCYAVVEFNKYNSDLRFIQDISLFTVINIADYNLGNFILVEKFNSATQIEIENWLPKSYLSCINSGNETVSKTEKIFYFDNTASYDSSVTIPEVPEITWREEIKQNYQVVGLKNVYEDIDEINAINIEDISIIYNGVEYKDLTIICPPSDTYFVSQDNTISYSMIVGFNNDNYCCQINLKKKAQS